MYKQGEFVALLWRVDFKQSGIYWKYGSDKSHGPIIVGAIFLISNTNDCVVALIALGVGVLAGNMHSPA